MFLLLVSLILLTKFKFLLRLVGIIEIDPMVIVLSTGSGVDGFFQSVKILSMASFVGEVKPSVPCSRFTARKITSTRNQSLLAKFVGLFTFYIASDADDRRCQKVSEIPITNFQGLWRGRSRQFFNRNPCPEMYGFCSAVTVSSN